MATLKQKLALKKITEEHRPVSRAMLEVGYTPHTASKPSNLTDSKGWKELVETYLPDDKLLEVHNKALNATKIVTSHTEPDYAIDDVPTQLRAVELGYKVKGKLSENVTNNQFNAAEMSVQFREATKDGESL
jgi:hypothetical protein